MAKYLALFSYTPEAIGSLIANPTDRAAAAAKLVKKSGGRLESFYWMLGPHDGVLIADYPDAASAASVAAIVASSGAIKSFVTYPLIDKDDIAAVLKKARGASGSYEKPGA